MGQYPPVPLLPPKERTKIPRHKIPEQDPMVRRTNFKEVNLGYTIEMAQAEAQRCLMCANPPCIGGCPVHIKIPQFIEKIREGDIAEAARILKEDNALPAVCGRVCPQEEQCEIVCVLTKKYQPVAIGNLERFAADWERENIGIQVPKIEKKTGKKSCYNWWWTCWIECCWRFNTNGTRRNCIRSSSRNWWCVGLWNS